MVKPSFIAEGQLGFCKRMIRSRDVIDSVTVGIVAQWFEDVILHIDSHLGTEDGVYIRIFMGKSFHSINYFAGHDYYREGLSRFDRCISCQEKSHLDGIAFWLIDVTVQSRSDSDSARIRGTQVSVLKGEDVSYPFVIGVTKDHRDGPTDVFVVVVYEGWMVEDHSCFSRDSRDLIKLS